jgi:hypothetical protein
MGIDFLSVLTPGRKLTKKTGFAVYAPNTNENMAVRISDNSSIFTAKLAALKVALKKIIEAETSNAK